MRNSPWCATCILERQRDILKGLCIRIRNKEVKEDTAIDILTGPDMIHYIGHMDILDSILYSMYISRQMTMMIRYLKYIRNTSVFQAILYLRIRNHTHTSLCPVYSWMIRNYMPIDMIPKSCLRCVTTAISYHPTPHVYRMLRFIDSHVPTPSPLPALLKDASIEYVGRFLDAVIQYTPVWVDTVVEYVKKARPDIEIDKHILLHPSIAHRKMESGSQVEKILLYKHLASMIEPFKNELMELSWEPSRVYNWCLTVDERDNVSSNY